MKRRDFNFLAGTGIAALSGVGQKALAQSAPLPFATLSKTTLTPYGAERAGNSAGTIPAWTGGMTTVPAGWDPEAALPPDFFANDSPLYTVSAANMSQYANTLSDGVQALIQKQGYSVQVYPTHRTAAAPQWVYDNIAQNAERAAFVPAGPQYGITGAFGGIPFPVPDISNPLIAGAQIIWNHETRWNGTYFSNVESSWVVASGVPVCATVDATKYYYPYYDPKVGLEGLAGYIYYFNVTTLAPADQAGEIAVVHASLSPETQPNITWFLELGLGRVRKAPEQTYDTPSSYSNGVSNYDEFYGFGGAMDRYDWKYLGKQEMLVPYNNNKNCHVPQSEIIGSKFPNPEVIRWELHRVWVVEATLRPGKRNVLARRRLYVDEDTWQVKITDSWDANGDIYHHEQTYNIVCPQLPGVVYSDSVVFNMQTGDYATLGGPSGSPPNNKPFKFDPLPMATFEPQTMAANSMY